MILSSKSTHYNGVICIETLEQYNKRRYKAYKNNDVFKPIKEYENKLASRYMKVGRIKRKIVYLLVRYQYNYFCTFTFNDKYIDKCDRTKKDMIKNVVFNYSDDIKMILNIDFGSKTEREHYHAIISTNKKGDFKKYLDKNYKCFSYTERIILANKSVEKISKYINKLSNHATKESTRRSRIYYNFKGYDSILHIDKNFEYLLDKLLLDGYVI